jgi:UDP-galactopyranose mutase
MTSIKKIACVGAGFTGSVIANVLASSKRYHVDVFDGRDHIGGNCHTARDPETGVMLHVYGPHLFHTNNQNVWDYVTGFSHFERYEHKVRATTSSGVFSMPINLLTINQLFDKRLSPAEAEVFISALGIKNSKPENFEEQALSMLGPKIYETFFKHYTEKHWGIAATQLPASIFQRLPIRFNYNDNYFNDRYQGLPVDGYTSLMQKMLDLPNIKLFLGKSIKRSDLKDYDHIFYSGTIDGWFDFKFGDLAYRTLDFELFRCDGDFQGASVMNYCEKEVPYTRITEFKHFTHWETHQRSSCYREFSRHATRKDIPYYPVRLSSDKSHLQKYVEEATRETMPVTFAGRLGTYRYLDMHMCIAESLDLAQRFMNSHEPSGIRFSSEPI